MPASPALVVLIVTAAGDALLLIDHINEKE
jgi:hypothetical protein